MNTNNRRPLLSLCLALLFLAGCSAPQIQLETATTELPVHNETQAEPSAASEDTGATETAEAEPAADPATEASVDEQTPEDAQETEEADLMTPPEGAVIDGVYRNDLLEITFAPPEEMAFAEESELQQIALVCTDTFLEGDDLQAVLNDESIRMLCYAADSSEAPAPRSFNITVQGAPSTQESLDTPLSESALISELVSKIEEPLARQGFSDIHAVCALTPFLGSLHPCMILSATIPDAGTLYERVVCIQKNDRIMSVTASCIGETDTTKEILDRVQPID